MTLYSIIRTQVVETMFLFWLWTKTKLNYFLCGFHNYPAWLNILDVIYGIILTEYEFVCACLIETIKSMDALEGKSQCIDRSGAGNELVPQKIPWGEDPTMGICLRYFTNLCSQISLEVEISEVIKHDFSEAGWNQSFELPGRKPTQPIPDVS